MKSNKPGTAIRKKTGVTSQVPEMPSDLHQQIAKRAYEIYERRIRQRALDDWLQAEQEVLQNTPHRGGYAGVEQE